MGWREFFGFGEKQTPSLKRTEPSFNKPGQSSALNEPIDGEFREVDIHPNGSADFLVDSAGRTTLSGGMAEAAAKAAADVITVNGAGVATTAGTAATGTALATVEAPGALALVGESAAAGAAIPGTALATVEAPGALAMIGEGAVGLEAATGGLATPVIAVAGIAAGVGMAGYGAYKLGRDHGLWGSTPAEAAANPAKPLSAADHAFAADPALLNPIADHPQSFIETPMPPPAAAPAQTAAPAQPASPAAPSAAAPVQAARPDHRTLKKLGGAEIRFKSGSAELDDFGKRVIAQQAKGVLASGSDEVDIFGLTDRSGSAEKNFHLSQERAEEVAAEWRKNGIKVSHVEGHGSEGSHHAHSAGDRRVVVAVVDGPPDMNIVKEELDKTFGKEKIAATAPRKSLLPTPGM